MYDVLIIGAGCVGAAAARELSRFKLKVAVVDRANDVSCGTSKANSGIVHGGYDAKYGSLKGKLSKRGNESFTLLSEQLGFSFDRCGSFVLAFDDEEKKKVEEIYQNGLKNGIEKLSIVDKDFILKTEPYVSENVKCALYSEYAGIVSPYEYTWALMENAVKNGCELFLNSSVIGIEKNEDVFTVKTNRGEILTKYIINAAGVHSDEIAAMITHPDFTIRPIRGEYMLFDKTEGKKAKSVLFQTPTGVSKGILVSPTVHGNIYVGPSYDNASDKDDVTTHEDVLTDVYKTALKTMPDIDKSKVITQFAGMRAVSDSADFIIGESETAGFINAAGISSPGLSTSYAIAEMLRDIIYDKAAPELKPDFDPYRQRPVILSELTADEINEIVKKDPAYGRIICRCEKITEGEIKNALNTFVPARDVDGVKRRVRAGMGRCQGGFCLEKVMELICREHGVEMDDVTKNGAGSYITAGKIFG